MKYLLLVLFAVSSSFAYSATDNATALNIPLQDYNFLIALLAIFMNLLLFSGIIAITSRAR